jgi:phage terminase large subunit
MSDSVTVELPYKPRAPFIPFHSRQERWAVLVAHRRAGKTVACVNDLVAKALKCKKPNGFFGYVGPFAGQVEQIAWSYLKQAVAAIPGHKVVETKKLVQVPSQHGSLATVRLFGADNPDALRGLYFDGVILDEFADMKRAIWSEVIRPALADRKGWAVFIGTPKGKNAFYDIYEKAKADPGRWFLRLLKASESGLLPPAELEELRAELDEETYQQELECSFTAGIKGSYYGDIISTMEAEGRLDPFEVVKAAPVHVVFDLGWKDATAAWFFQIVSGECRVVDHQEWNFIDIHRIIKEVRERGYKLGTIWLPHDAKAHSLQTGKSMLEQFWRHELYPKQVPELDELDGIAATRLTLPALRINSATCYQGIEALKNFQKKWNAELGAFARTPKEDWTNHSADAMRYLCLAVRDADLKASLPQTITGAPLRGSAGSALSLTPINKPIDVSVIGISAEEFRELELNFRRMSDERI